MEIPVGKSLEDKEQLVGVLLFYFLMKISLNVEQVQFVF